MDVGLDSQSSLHLVDHHAAVFGGFMVVKTFRGLPVIINSSS